MRSMRWTQFKGLEPSSSGLLQKSARKSIGRIRPRSGFPIEVGRESITLHLSRNRKPSRCLTPRLLDTQPRRSQTKSMPHIYMHFDFGKDEEKAQLARHKLEVWKQAFRLDNKLLYNFDRPTEREPAPAPLASTPQNS